MAKHRTSDFHPTEFGATLMPIATGVSPATIEFGRASRASAADTTGAARCDALRRTTEYADVAAAHVHCESLELELRGPSGAVVPTEWIDVRDTEFLVALTRDDALSADDLAASLCDESWPYADDEELDPQAWLADGDDLEALEDFNALEELDDFDADFDWEPDDSSDRPFPRYQLQVMLLDDSAIP